MGTPSESMLTNVDVERECLEHLKAEMFKVLERAGIAVIMNKCNLYENLI